MKIAVKMYTDCWEIAASTRSIDGDAGNNEESSTLPPRLMYASEQETLDIDKKAKFAMVNLTGVLKICFVFPVSASFFILRRIERTEGTKAPTGPYAIRPQRVIAELTDK